MQLHHIAETTCCRNEKGPIMFELTRRDLWQSAGLSLAGINASGWLPAIANALPEAKSKRRHCILLWMPGGPSQTDTFDMKPGHANGGEFKPIKTNVPGVEFSEHLPLLAKQADKMAIVRSLSTAEGDHNRGTYLMHTGHAPGGPISYPTIGSSLSKAMSLEDNELPDFVSISPYTVFNRNAFGPGFLGPRHAPLTVGGVNNIRQRQQQNNSGGYPVLGVEDLNNTGVSKTRTDARLDIWQTIQSSFLETHDVASPRAHDTVYQRAVKMMQTESAKAFDLADEPEKVRQAYGANRFGQSCLMARRLIERGVSFIEIALRGANQGVLGWDTHNNNFARTKTLSAELDAGWSSLMRELDQRGLLDSTTIIWTGEFGRTPKINRNGGRDHYPRAWTSVLAGGGINGGQVIGKTSKSGETVEEGKADVGDLMATLCAAVKVDPQHQNISAVGRPIRIAAGTPIAEALS
jgi:hypothetical protein